MRRALLLAALLLLPTAEACSLAMYSGATFDPLAWTGPDTLRFDRGGYDWVEVDVGSGETVEIPSRHWPDPPPATATPAMPSPSGGEYTLEPLRGPPSGAMQSNCWGPPLPMPGALYGYRLWQEWTDRQGHYGVQRITWESGNQTVSWAGSVWQNATHGFVWDHHQRRLDSVRWSDGQVTGFEVDLGAVDDYWLVFPDFPVTVLDGSQLVLIGRSRVAVLDPADGGARIVESPLEHDPEGNLDSAEIRGGRVLFSHWGDGKQKSVAAVDLRTGETFWQVEVEAEHTVTTQRGLVAIDDAGGSVKVYRDGVALHAFSVPPGNRTAVATQGERIALGLAGDTPRLLVFGDAMETLVDRPAREVPDDASTTPARGAPAVLAPVTALALLAVAFARRLRP